MRLPITKWFLEWAAGLDKRRDMPAFAGRSFLKAGPKYLASCEPIAKPIDKVAYFVDTYANYNDHELGFAVLEVLGHNDIEVTLPKQRPTPLPAIVYGDVKTARRDLAYSVRHLARVVREGYKIVCSEPSAALCLQQELRHFVAGEDAKLVSKNTFELMSYLLRLFRQDKLKPAAKAMSQEYVYHCPCHLSALGGVEASIELLEKVCGVNVVDLNSGCCGLAGTFGMQKKNYELSSRISERLAEALESTSVKYVLTECSACKMQIEHISNCIVSHPIKILAEAYT
jgi:Fe-S oxidoreductase